MPVLQIALRIFSPHLDITVIEAKPNYLLPELLPFIIQNDALFSFAVEKSAGSPFLITSFSPIGATSEPKRVTFKLPVSKCSKPIEIRLRKIGRELSFHKVHPHKFRRTLATMAIDKGMPIEQVQQLLMDTLQFLTLVMVMNHSPSSL